MADADIVSVIEKLVNAENTRDPKLSASVLSKDFTGITRARGVEQNRDEMLEEVAHPKNPDERRLEPKPWVRQSGDLAVVKSIVTMPDAAQPSGIKRFRNLHVLTREGGEWKCVAWQVTGLA